LKLSLHQRPIQGKGPETLTGDGDGEKLQKSQGKSIELNETLATIAHLYSRSKKNEHGQRSQTLYKRDFWRIFGEVQMLRQQIEGNRSKNLTRDQLRQMTDDMFDVLAAGRGWLGVEDLVRFFYPSAAQKRVDRSLPPPQLL